MSDFEEFSAEIEDGMDWLEHHQILGAKWGVMNGPPYPLGKGDHSASEKSAAKAAGVKVGSDSGKGSIENVQKKKKKSGVQNNPKKELTDEEKRAAALEAVRNGDKKKITKYMDYLTTEELRDAQARSQMKDSLSKKDDQKASKSDMEKLEAIRSGDKEKVKQYADKMSLQELQEAMNKVDLMAKLNYVEPPPTTMDKIRKAAQIAGTFKDVAEKGIAAYNVVAKVHNAVNKDSETKWPIIGDKPTEEKKDGEKEKAKEAVKEVGKEVKKTYEEQAKEKLENKKTDYKMNKKYEDWEAKQKAKEKANDDKNSPQTEKEARTEQNESNQTNNSPQTEKEARTEQHESNKNFGIHRFNSKTHERVSQAAKEVSGNEFQVDVAFTDKNYSKGPQVKSVNWDTKVNAENISNWRGTWNSVEQASANSRPISDDLTPAEEAFLNSFKSR